MGIFGYLALPCSFRSIDCGENGQCESTFNDYSCLCDDRGFKMDDKNPQSVCLIDNCFNVDCGFNNTCTNTIGKYQCGDGYYHKNKSESCQDIDECTTDKFLCGEQEYGECNNLNGTYICDCNQGFENINSNQHDSVCIDTDECLGINNCGYNNTCTNSIGSYQCECFEGYYNEEESEPCQDIDECLSEVASFEPDFCQGGICSNDVGGYDCTCPSSSFLAYDNGPNRVPFCGMI